MTHGRHITVENPDALTIRVTHEFDAPIDLVFDVLTKTEHVRRTIVPFDEEVTACDIDLRMNGSYHFAFVAPGEHECSFRGTYLEIDAPRRISATWHFEGWPTVHATETMELSEHEGVTRLAIELAFPDQAARDHMKGADGYVGNMQQLESYLRELLTDAR